MFTFATRVNYKVNAEEEAKQIKERMNAYKVKYLGTRTFVVFKSVKGEALFNKIHAERGGFEPSCKCWS